MGMLGAMAGAGEGMQKYSTKIQEKQKLDWQAQQNELAYIRQQNLQELAGKRSSADKEAEREVTREGMLQKSEQFTQTHELAGKQLDATIDNANATREQTKQLTEQKMALEERLANAREAGADSRLTKELEGRIAAIEAQTAGTIEVTDAKLEKEHEITRNTFEAFQKTADWEKLPDSMKQLTKLQFSVSGTADISKFLGTMKSSSSMSGMVGPDGKFHSPSAAHLKEAMEYLIEDPAFANQTPAAKLAMAAKAATQIANGQEISYSGKVLAPSKWEGVAKELAEGKRDFSSVRVLNKESIDGIFAEYEKINPSTDLDSKPPAVVEKTVRTGGMLGNVAGNKAATPGRQLATGVRNIFTEPANKSYEVDPRTRAAVEALNN